MASRADQVPVVEVGVAWAVRDGRVLVTWNDQWQEFTAPMTKLRGHVDPAWQEGPLAEAAVLAAARAAAEVLHRPVSPAELPDQLLTRRPIDYTLQSHRDGQIRHYRAYVYPLRADAWPPVRAPHAWLTPDQIVSHQPVSDAVRRIDAHLRSAGES